MFADAVDRLECKAEGLVAEDNGGFVSAVW